MDGFVRVGKVDEFKQGKGRAVRVGEIKVAIFRFGDRFHAIQDRCPHMGASLADGRVLDGWVECFWHGWTFNLEDGQSDQKSRQWLCADIFETKVRAGEVWVREPESRKKAEPAQADDDWVVWDDRFIKKDSAQADGDEGTDHRHDEPDDQHQCHGPDRERLPDE